MPVVVVDKNAVRPPSANVKTIGASDDADLKARHASMATLQQLAADFMASMFMKVRFS